MAPPFTLQPAPRSVLVVGGIDPRYLAALVEAGWSLARADDAGAAREHGAVVVYAPARAALSALGARTALLQAGFDTALVVLTEEGDVAAEAALLAAGVEDIVVAGAGGGPADAAALARAVRHAVARKAVERSARTAYATDLATGLPHRMQLIEHMSQLLALREREPAPMVLLVLRVEGCAAAAAQLGAEAGNVLRRKVAVRLRSALRAGDVVAAVDTDDFAVLLAHVESKDDGARVAAKLVAALRQPVVVAGQACRVSAAIGIAVAPDHGKQARPLLDRALAEAAAAGGGNVLGTVPSAANDDGPGSETEPGDGEADGDRGGDGRRAT